MVVKVVLRNGWMCVVKGVVFEVVAGGARGERIESELVQGSLGPTIAFYGYSFRIGTPLAPKETCPPPKGTCLRK